MAEGSTQVCKSCAAQALVAACLLLSACGDIEDLVDSSERLETRAARSEAVLDRIDQCLNAGAVLEPQPDGSYLIRCL